MPTNTSEGNEISFRSPHYIGKVESKITFLEKEPIKNLVASFENDIGLRKFFLKRTFPGLVDKCFPSKENETRIVLEEIANSKEIAFNNNYKDMVQYTEHFPFFTNWIKQMFALENFFQESLKKSISEVIETCLKKGLLDKELEFVFFYSPTKIEVYASTDEEELDKKRKSYLGKGQFFSIPVYQIGDELSQLWLKSFEEEDPNFLEIWIYLLVKKIIEENNLPWDVLLRVNIYPKTSPEPFTDLDVLLQSKGADKEKIAIDCKSNGNIRIIQKFKGVLSFLKIDKGIAISSKKFGSLGSQYQLDNITIFQNVAETKNFPAEFKKIILKLVEA